MSPNVMFLLMFFEISTDIEYWLTLAVDPFKFYCYVLGPLQNTFYFVIIVH
jgi:hypothetical protein